MYVQHSPLLGAEVRVATFPFYEHFSQSPITGGYRAEKRVWQRYLVAGYFGGGMSKGHDIGPHPILPSSGYYVPTPSAWSPCWQASQSTAIDFGRWKWKVYEATFTDTYTPFRSISSFSLTTGVVYSFSKRRKFASDIEGDL
jgi:hypothetical protein